MPDLAYTVTNKTDGNFVLPTTYSKPSDKKDGKNGRKISLGAACDRGVAGKLQPEATLDEFEFKCLESHGAVQAAVQKGLIEFRHGRVLTPA